MGVDAFKMRVRGNESFVFASTPQPHRLKQISSHIQSAGGRVVGPGAWSFEGDSGSLASVSALFDRLEKDECIYVLRWEGERLSYGVIAQPNTEGGILVTY
jgi:hypothetical protein